MPSTILRPHILGFKNRFFHRQSDTRERQRALTLCFVSSLLMLCIFFGFFVILKSVEDDQFFQSLIPTKIIELVFYSFFFLLSLSTVAATIGNSYTAHKMDLFLSLPISNARLYFAKLIETICETGTMFFVFSLPAGLAYVAVFDLNASFLVVGAVLAIPFLIIPAGLSFVIGTLFVRASSFFWKRGVFFLIVLIATVIWVLIKLFNLMVTVKAEKAGMKVIVQMISLFDNPSPLWLPSRWVSDILSLSLDHHTPAPNVCLALLLTSALGAIALGFLVFDLFFLSVRSTTATQEQHTALKSDLVRRLLDRFFSVLPIEQQTRAIIIKDLSSLLRDRAQALQLLLFLGIATIYVVVFHFLTFVLNLHLLAQQAWHASLALLNIVFSSIILITIMTRLVYPAMSLEGNVFWILAVSPLEVKKLVRAKFLCWLPITTTIILSLLLAGTAAIQLPFEAQLMTVIIGVSISIGFTGLAIGFGSLFASFDWESPSQLSAGFGTLVLMLATLSLICLLTLPTATAIALGVIPRLREIVGPITSFLLMSFSTFLVIFINVFVSGYACKKGAAALEARIKQ